MRTHPTWSAQQQQKVWDGGQSSMGSQVACRAGRWQPASAAHFCWLAVSWHLTSVCATLSPGNCTRVWTYAAVDAPQQRVRRLLGHAGGRAAVNRACSCPASCANGGTDPQPPETA
jgi:hypothetical protein